MCLEAVFRFMQPAAVFKLIGKRLAIMTGREELAMYAAVMFIEFQVRQPGLEFGKGSIA